MKSARLCRSPVSFKSPHDFKTFANNMTTHHPMVTQYFNLTSLPHDLNLPFLWIISLLVERNSGAFVEVSDVFPSKN